ncbi:MAG: UDP-N-acetylmuramoyl-L-alanyl-D-glutamate--2,6-diaminopimelate ligase [Candidatus Flexifilum sp.]
MTTTLTDLLAALPQPYTLHGDGATVIGAPVVESDADVEPGGVFVARRGLTTDGHRFIPQAVARGAAAIIGERDPAELPALAVPYVRVADAQEAVGWLASAYHGRPSERLIVIGVTGTDGKTTTSTLIHRILNDWTGGRAGLITTIAAELGEVRIDTGLHVTTPGAPLIQALLARMVASGMTHCVLEMTSHGLAQGRLNGVAIDIAVITNLTHEHLDYHGTFENYRAAKGRMFAMLDRAARKPGQPKISIVNADDPNAAFFAAFPADRHLRYGVDDAGADVRAVAVQHMADGSAFTVVQPDGARRPFHLPLPGAFNVMNALAAITTARALGIADDAIQRGLSAVTGISGRLEPVTVSAETCIRPGITALVDFAHTPNALRNALMAARTLTRPGGRVICAFGCAGLRDVEKRRLMPAIAVQLAEISIFTAEDPRTESLADILETMAEAAIAAGGVEGQTFERVPDRGRALLRAVELARPGDVVIACGKGHEQSMAFGTVEYPWDDRAALRAALTGTALGGLPTSDPASIR